MPTECNKRSFDFQPLGSREVTARFDGGTITSDAGGLLWREVEAQTGMLADLARCFDDFRDPELIEHSVEGLIKQRVFALALACRNRCPLFPDGQIGNAWVGRSRTYVGGLCGGCLPGVITLDSNR